MLYTLYQVMHKDHLCSSVAIKKGTKQICFIPKTEKLSHPECTPLIYLSEGAAQEYIKRNLDSNYFVQEFSGNEEVKELAII